jgi:ESS family glutamate:Na+ symporter
LNIKHEIVSTDIHIESHSKVTFFDALTSQVVLLLLIYGVTFLIVLATQVFLPDEGILSQFKTLFYGLHFLIGVFVAFGFKALQKRYKFRGKDLRFMTNDYLLQSISSFMFNVMITASVLVVTTSSVREYLPFILIATTVAGLASYFYFRMLARWQFDNHQHEYTIGLYGNNTGTISTGIALVKMLDPNLEKPVVQDLVLGSGTALFFAIPLLGMLVMPATFAEAGMPLGTSALYIFLALFGYFFILMGGLAISKRRRLKKNG